MTSANTEYAKSGDSLPIFSATLRDGAGVPVDILSSYTITFKLRERGAPTSQRVFGGLATIVKPDIDLTTNPNDPALGAVTYALDPGIILPPGVYESEWTLHTPSGRETTFPDTGMDILYVSRRLPNPT